MATVGTDGHDYVQRLQSWGASTEYVRVTDDSYTAQAIIITDTDNNQSTPPVAPGQKCVPVVETGTSIFWMVVTGVFQAILPAVISMACR